MCFLGKKKKKKMENEEKKIKKKKIKRHRNVEMCEVRFYRVIKCEPQF